MIYIVCKKCGTVIRTSGHPEQVDNLVGTKSEWYPNNYPCPEYSCDGHAEIVDSIAPETLRNLRLRDLTPEEAFVAFSGLDLPDERDCGPHAIMDALKSPVVFVETTLIPGTNRTIIYYIQFESGERMYFGGSSYGAVVYRIAKKPEKHRRTEECLKNL